MPAAIVGAGAVDRFSGAVPWCALLEAIAARTCARPWEVAAVVAVAGRVVAARVIVVAAAAVKVAVDNSEALPRSQRIFDPMG